MANYVVSDTNLTAIADAIRAKGGTLASLSFPEGMTAAIAAIQGGGSEPTKNEWVQTPAPVKSFIDEVTYNPSDYSTSQIDNYAPDYCVATNTKPIGKTIPTDAGTLIQGEYKKSVTAGNNTLYNAIPNRETLYGVIDSNGDIKQNGSLKPSGFLRWIKTETPNVRDLGGWSCDGGTVKYGKLFRGGEPVATDTDVMVNQCGIRQELQLRGLNDSPQPYSLWGVDYFCVDSFIWYTLNTDSEKAKVWKQILRCVFDSIKNDKPVFFHCSAGADRTGTVAVILEGILGMSQSDIDKDYEISSFYTGTVSGATARRRNEAEYSGLISAINALTVGTTFRDKTINWVASLGFTADEINAFRVAMIDGTPETITILLDDCNITNSLSNVTSDNTAESVTEYQPYTANIVPTNGYAISNITVTMGGVDITTSVFSGTKTVFRNSVTNNLTNCTTNNSKAGVVNGEAYVAILTANTGYTMDGATVTIMMGGINVSTFYENGKIIIPNVTGNVVITATAVQNAHSYTNVLPLSVETDGTPYNSGLGYKNGYRINSSGLEVALDGAVITGFIPVVAGDIIRFSGKYICGNLGSENTMFYDSSRAKLTLDSLTPYLFAHDLQGTDFSPYEYDATNQRLLSFTVRNDSRIAYIRITLHAATGADAIITVNEVIE